MSRTPCLGLSMTLQDAAALAGARGPGTSIVLGDAGGADIFAPAEKTLTLAEAASALAHPAGSWHLCFGNQESAPDPDRLGPLLDLAIQRTGLGFMAASFAAPEQGRTVYHGHLFQDGQHLGNLRRLLAESLSARIAIVPHAVIAAGPQAIRQKLAACREQNFALALLDAVDPAQCAAIAQALDSQRLLAGPAWLAARAESPPQAEPPAVERLAILSGALDRQTLYQLGAARSTIPFLQLDFSAPDVTPAALTWAAAQNGDFIIAASAPPDARHPDAPAAAILADIAAGLAATGTRRFLITGNDTAAAILARLGVQKLNLGATAGGLCWLNAHRYNFLLKPSGFGGRNLFLDGFEPHIRLNATAECTP
jgi:3-dehydrotetronate 4-kinase